jgi:uncharacterized coiled-coil protein SlyX
MKRQNLINILIGIVCIGLLPRAQAVVPAPDGGYPGGNTAEGQNALFSLTTGGFNTAVGYLSLRSDTTGQLNTAIGAGTLLANTGDNNTATGTAALLSNNIGGFNTADGTFALFSNTSGVGNTAVGYHALAANTTGSANTAIGDEALRNKISGEENIALGLNVGNSVFTANHVICIGANFGGADVSNSTWIANIYGVTTLSGTTAPVVVSDGGQLGTMASSERFKKDIATMDRASEIILSLRPVTFHYKSDARETPQFGLIAEEVAKVNPALVLPDKEGKPYTVRYDAVNAMLLNEFLKEHRKMEEQQATIAELKSTVAQQQESFAEQRAQIQALASGLQKVSAQIEVSKPTPTVVVNTP